MATAAREFGTTLGDATNKVPSATAAAKGSKKRAAKKNAAKFAAKTAAPAATTGTNATAGENAGAVRAHMTFKAAATIVAGTAGAANAGKKRRRGKRGGKKARRSSMSSCDDAGTSADEGASQAKPAATAAAPAAKPMPMPVALPAAISTVFAGASASKAGPAPSLTEVECEDEGEASAEAAPVASVEEIKVEEAAPAAEPIAFPTAMAAEGEDETDTAALTAAKDSDTSAEVTPTKPTQAVLATAKTPAAHIEASVFGRISYRIDGWETRAIGCFSKYTVYMVRRESSSAEPFGRRYSDFRALFKALRREFPTAFAGYSFPPKASMPTRAGVIATRETGLQAFLDIVTSNAELASHADVQQFLSPEVGYFAEAEA